VFSVLGSISNEKEQKETNTLLYYWAKEHEDKLRELGITLKGIFERFETFGDRIKERIESKEYLILVRKTFKIWDESETVEKKEMLRKLITNAGGADFSQDDLIRMFLGWIEKYHEFYFLIIGQIHREPGITRREMWVNIRGEIPRDDSADADLFKLLIDDLSQGRVIRQAREVDYQGRFMTRRAPRRLAQRNETMQTPFEDTKEYVLTELGSQFVRYVMNELTLQIEAK
jgi:hypothetical protein